jgi:hypothetical protein
MKPEIRDIIAKKLAHVIKTTEELRNPTGNPYQTVFYNQIACSQFMEEIKKHGWPNQSSMVYTTALLEEAESLRKKHYQISKVSLRVIEGGKK